MKKEHAKHAGTKAAKTSPGEGRSSTGKRRMTASRKREAVMQLMRDEPTLSLEKKRCIRWMTISSGKECYSLGAPPCKGSGRQWTKKELDEALEGEVSSLLFDDAGRAELEDLLTDIGATDFERETFSDIVAGDEPGPGDIKSWSVGEAIAEAYLMEHRRCIFPWPIGRDERKKGSSLPGADLVGIKCDDRGDRFVFGEVKTSTQAKYPPGVVDGRSGLAQQIEDIRDKKSIRDRLFIYLGRRAKGADWKERYLAAARRYLKDNRDVHLFGVLVRDVAPDERDIRARVDKLGKNCPISTEIDLLAIYLPPDSIDGLGSKVSAMRAMRKRKGDRT